MNKSFNRIFLFLLAFTLVGCGNNSSSSTSKKIDYEGDGYVDKIPENNESAIILQAFNWTFDQIKTNLPSISRAGFKAVQTSPVQQPKGGGASWWAFYQPVSFSIATNSPLGSKEDLKSLCEEAETYGIDIICDIVVNHMANISDTDLEADGTPKVNPDVNNYEPEIYQNRNASGDSATFHHNPRASGSGAVTQFYPYGKLPDLNTANPTVQARVLSLLKECIDVGVDGFRFDAAKHVETPDDPEYASSFWTNTLGVAKTYYNQKTGKNLFAYGEVLNDPDGGRDISLYTKHMKVTDNSYIDDVNAAVMNKKADRALEAKYGKKVDASALVAWAESHDTYIDATSHISDKKVAREWAIIASRKDLNCMYLARPDDIASVGVVGSYYFENESIATINRFHNRFIGANEAQSSDGKAVYINERYSENDEGAIIVDLALAGTVNATFNKIKDGIYVDQVSGNFVEVKNHKATFSSNELGIVILTHTVNKPLPCFEINKRNCSFVNNLTITIEATNASESYYTINGGERVDFTNSTSFTIGNNLTANNEVVLTISLSNGEKTTTSTFTYKKLIPIDGFFNIFNINSSYLTDYELYMWTWGNNQNGKWSKPEYQMRDGIMLLDFSKVQYSSFLLAIFPKNYVVSNADSWDNNCIKQTSDINISSGFYDATNF